MTTRLFDSHVADLQAVCPDADAVFVCPICLHVFQENQRSDLTIGHVWPKYLRASASLNHQVLLCNKCNSQAGANGDAEMQKYEQFLDDEDSDTSNIERKIDIQPNTEGEDSFSLRGFVTKPQESPDGGYTSTIKIRGSEGYFEHNPDMQKYIDLTHSEGSADVIIHFPDIDIDLAKIGYFTSAYLMLFHMFGYRFVLQKTVDPVRKVILDSFQKVVASLKYAKYKSMCVQLCSIHNTRHPQVSFVYAHKSAKPLQFFQVDVLRFHVRIPVQVTCLPYLRSQAQSQIGLKADIAHVPHPNRFCAWDYRLGEPDYCVIGSELKLS